MRYWYCGSCGIEHDLSDSYYCVNCFGEHIGKKTFTPTKTSSPISTADPPRNELVRIVRQRQKRAAEDMVQNNH